jgi:hypothetical protein
MSRSFLAMFRGADARSIAHALAILLVFNAVFGAFHSGAMAKAATGEVVLCSSEGAVRASEGLPQEPADPQDMSCCVLGNGPTPAAIASEPAGLSAPTSPASAFAPPFFDSTVAGPKHPGSASPRGPPKLA